MSKINKDTDFFAYVDNFAKYKHVQSVRLYGEHKSTSPKVSITIPTYRRPELLKEAVLSALNQEDYDDYEIVIVDNDATGEFTSKIIEMLKTFVSDKIVYYRNQENIGMFGNWNRCIELATGEWMTILSDDDLLSVRYLKVLLSFVSVNVDRIDSFGRVLYNKFEQENFKNQLTDRFFPKICGIPLPFLTSTKKVQWHHYIHSMITPIHGSIMRKEKLLELGGFNEDFWPSADYILAFRYAYFSNKIIRVNQFLVGVRVLVNESLNPKTLRGFKLVGKNVVYFLLKRKDRFIYRLYVKYYFKDLFKRQKYSIFERLFRSLFYRLIIC